MAYKTAVNHAIQKQTKHVEQQSAKYAKKKNLEFNSLHTKESANIVFLCHQSKKLKPLIQPTEKKKAFLT